MAPTRKRKLKLPTRYFSGLSKEKKKQRLKEIQKFGEKASSDPTAYVGFKTDIGVKTRKSSYTKDWQAKFPAAHSLQDKSTVTGVPLKYIMESYNRGLAAWRTGHRPGATEQQWGYARVHSFLLCGKTFHTADSDIARRAMSESKSANTWFKSQAAFNNSYK